MGFDIRIDGLDNFARELEKLNQGLSDQELNFWCERISNEIKLNAPEGLGESLVMKVSLNAELTPELELSYHPTLGELIISTIQIYLNQMPMTTQAFFSKVIEIIQEKLDGNKAQDV